MILYENFLKNIDYQRDYSYFGPFLICFTRMLISTASMVVKSARKMKKVVATLPASMSEMAALTGSRSWMVQGWRPMSDTIQPDYEEM